MFAFVQNGGTCQENDVFRQSLPVRQGKGCSETAAVGHRVVYINICGQRCHAQHGDEGDNCRRAFSDAQQDIDAKHEFQRGKSYDKNRKQGGVVFERMSPVAEIGVGFVKHAKRVGGFYKARHDERGGKAKAADRDNPEGYDIFNFLVQYPV